MEYRYRRAAAIVLLGHSRGWSWPTLRNIERAFPSLIVGIGFTLVAFIVLHEVGIDLFLGIGLNESAAESTAASGVEEWANWFMDSAWIILLRVLSLVRFLLPLMIGMLFLVRSWKLLFRVR